MLFLQREQTETFVSSFRMMLCRRTWLGSCGLVLNVWPLVRASWTARVKVQQCGHWQKLWRRLWKMSATFFVSSVSVEMPATLVAWMNCLEKGCRRHWRFLIASLLNLNCAMWAQWCLWSRLRNMSCSSSLLFCSQRHSRGHWKWSC